MAHCWEEGPEICNQCGGQDCDLHMDWPYRDSVGTLCLLLEGHMGPHEWTPKIEILLEFRSKGESGDTERGQ